MRSYDRDYSQTRPLTIVPGFNTNAAGSVLISCGNTKVLCTAHLEEKVPPFLRNQKKGWVTAEYGMLPGSTHSRSIREAARGKQTGRTMEISRLIARALRSCVDMVALGENTVTIDCDVLQADGGTRTTSMTGGFVALALCLYKHKTLFKKKPLVGSIAAISLGLLKDQIYVDLDYEEDSTADVDLNLVMNHQSHMIEVQGTAEHAPFTKEQMIDFLTYGEAAITKIRELQYAVLKEQGVDESWLR